MLMRVLLSTLTALLLLTVSADAIRAQEKLPGDAFTFTPSHDELTWRPFFHLEAGHHLHRSRSVGLVRIPPNKDGWHSHPHTYNLDQVIRVLSPIWNIVRGIQRRWEHSEPS